MKRLRRTLVIPVLLAGVTATVAVAQDSSSHSDRSDRSDRSSRSDRDSRRSDRSDRSSRTGSSRYSSSYASAATTQPGGFLDGYRLVLDRNIFSRSRVIYRESSAAPTTAPTGGSSRSLPALSLTGVTKEGAAATAFIEDRRSNSTTFLHIGDAIADGKLTAINLDSIEYVTGDGKTVRVELGQVIEGGPTYTVSSSGSSYSSGAFGPSGGSPGATHSAAPGTSIPAPSGGGGDSNDILERLRQKRLQETKR